MNSKNKRLSLFMAFFVVILTLLISSVFIFQNKNTYPITNSSLPDNYVTEVIDGDTFQINNGETIRLLCVDTPEKNQEGYEEAREFLESMILGREVILNSSVTDKDIYNRSLRYVYVNDSFVNKMILNQGYGELLVIPPEECREVEEINDSKYPLHKNISVTIFWAGEEAGEDNGFISNLQSAWDDRWLEHSVNENPFYFALPYNDFDEDKRKSNSKNISWAKEKNWGELESMCKNRWIKIIKGENIAYAQWEDAGPFGEDDFDYVFGGNLPKNKINNNAGLDVSPSVMDYLKLGDIDSVSWQFVDFSEVPDGAWKTTITSSQIFWE